MSIVFNSKPGILIDAKFSLMIIYNFEWFESKIEGFGIKLPKDFLKNLKQLKKFVDCDKVYMDVFFNTDIYGHNDQILELPGIDREKLWYMDSYDDLINAIKVTSEEDVKKSIVSQLLDLKERENELEEIMKDDKKVIDLIESLSCSAGSKWSLVKFLNNIKMYMDELIEFLTKYLKEYDKVVSKRVDEMSIFNNYIEKNLEESGVEFLKKILSGIWDTDSFKEIYVSTMHINSVSCAGSTNGDKLYIFIGSNFEDAVKQINGADKEGECVTLFKGLSDITRFKILKLLLEKEVFGQEIANAFGISMATVNYHMTLLLTTKVVQLRRKGQKTYYSLNKERLKDGIKFLEETFKL